MIAKIITDKKITTETLSHGEHRDFPRFFPLSLCAFVVNVFCANLVVKIPKE